MSLTPIALLCFAVLLREETWDVRQLLAIGLGVTGLLILFGPDAMSDAAGSSPTGETLRLWGTAAVASAAFTYGWAGCSLGPCFEPIRRFSSRA